MIEWQERMNISMGLAAGKARRLGRAIIRWVTRNPVLSIAFVLLVLRYGLPLVSSGFQDGLAGLLWTGSNFWLRPFSLIATWVDPYLRQFPEFVDVLGTLLSGLVPYAAVDAVYRLLILRPGTHSGAQDKAAIRREY
jgi:hypothetical protein